MQAIILTAGEGARLSGWTTNRPKGMISLGNRPILDYLVRGIAESGINEINMVCDVSNKGSGKKLQKWEEYNFVDMPAVGALTILSKIQSDLTNIESDVINYLKRNIDAKSLKFTSAEGIQIPKTNFVY